MFIHIRIATNFIDILNCVLCIMKRLQQDDSWPRLIKDKIFDKEHSVNNICACFMHKILIMTVASTFISKCVDLYIMSHIHNDIPIHCT